MKRDMDLVRRMLLAIEQKPPYEFFTVPNRQFEDYDSGVQQMHMVLLKDAGLVAGGGTNMTEFCMDLSWEGHEFFLDATRDPSVWEQVKQRAMTVAGGMSIEVLYMLAKQLVKEKLGLAAVAE
ncbi:MAG: DUF2513 domain-containing protein [Planctomycetaceae bacterium]